MYWQSAGYANALYQMYIDDIMQIALSRFKWVNMPATCDARYLEWVLLNEGAATIAHPKGAPDKVLTLRAVQQGEPNMYSNPRAWRAIGSTGRTDFACDWTNGVFVWDNLTRFPTMGKIFIWARELADIMQTMQMNRTQMRVPIFITGSQDKGTDMLNIYQRMANGEPVVLGYESLSEIKAEPMLPEHVKDYLNDKLFEEYKNAWDAVYRMLGIDSLPYKEERMIEDEVSSTMEPTELAQLSPLGCRRAACRKFNEVHGTDIWCVWNSDISSDNYRYALDTRMRAEEGGDDGDVPAV